MNDSYNTPLGERMARNEQRISDLSDRLVSAATRADIEGLEARVKSHNQESIRIELKIITAEMKNIARIEAEHAYALMEKELSKREGEAKRLAEQAKTNWPSLLSDILKIAIAPLLIFLIARAMGASDTQAVEITSAFS